MSLNRLIVAAFRLRIPIAPNVESDGGQVECNLFCVRNCNGVIFLVQPVLDTLDDSGDVDFQVV